MGARVRVRVRVKVGVRVRVRVRVRVWVWARVRVRVRVRPAAVLRVQQAYGQRPLLGQPDESEVVEARDGERDVGLLALGPGAPVRVPG